MNALTYIFFNTHPNAPSPQDEVVKSLESTLDYLPPTPPVDRKDSDIDSEDVQESKPSLFRRATSWASNAASTTIGRATRAARQAALSTAQSLIARKNPQELREALVEKCGKDPRFAELLTQKIAPRISTEIRSLVNEKNPTWASVLDEEFTNTLVETILLQVALNIGDRTEPGVDYPIQAVADIIEKVSTALNNLKTADKEDLDTALTPLRDELLTLFFPQGKDSIPLCAPLNNLVWVAIKSLLLSTLSSAYENAEPSFSLIKASEANKEKLQTIYQSPCGEQAAHVLARFARDFAGNTIANDSANHVNSLFEVITDKLDLKGDEIAWLKDATLKYVEKLKNGEGTTSLDHLLDALAKELNIAEIAELKDEVLEHLATLKQQGKTPDVDDALDFAMGKLGVKEEQMASLKDAVLAHTVPAGSEWLNNIETYLESAFLHVIAGFSENIQNKEQADADFLTNTAIDLMELVGTHLQTINAIRREERAPSANAGETRDPYLVGFEERNLLHRGITLSDNPEDVKKAGIKHFSIPLSIRVLKIAGLHSEKELPIPSAAQPAVWKLLTETVVPEMIEEHLASIFKEGAINEILLDVVRDLENKPRTSSPAPETTAASEIPTHQDATQKRLNTACGTLVMELIDNFPLGILALPMNIDLVKEKVAEAIGEKMRQQLGGKMQILSLLKSGLEQKIPALHPGASINQEGRLVTQETGEDFHFTFKSEPEAPTQPAAKGVSDPAEVRKELKERIVNLIRKETYLALEETAAAAWNGMHQKIEDLLRAHLGEWSVSTKAAIDKLLHVIFFVMMGSILYGLSLPLQHVANALFTKYVTDHVEATLQLTNRPIHKNLLYQLSDRLVERLDPSTSKISPLFPHRDRVVEDQLPESFSTVNEDPEEELGFVDSLLYHMSIGALELNHR